MPGLRDRFFTPRVAKAITSPLGILMAGAGASLAILGGLPLAGAAVVAALAYGARVAAAVGTGEQRGRMDPFTLKEPWRQYVQGAQQAKARFDRAVLNTAGGPLRDRLTEIGERIDDGVANCWRIANQGHLLESALQDLDVMQAARELQAVERDADQSGSANANLARTADSLRAQLSSAQRMARVAADARDRLRLLDARLDESVARAVELSLGTGADADLTGLGADVDVLVEELEALRAAMEETSGGPPTGTLGLSPQ